MDIFNSLGSAQCETKECDSSEIIITSRPTMLDNLKREKKVLEEKLTLISDAIQKIEKYPEICEVLQSISKIRF